MDYPLTQFSLLKLPMVARNEAIKLMDLESRICLSIISNRMQFWVKEARTKIELPIIKLIAGIAIVQLEKRDELEIVCDSEGLKMRNRILHLNTNPLLFNVSRLIFQLHRTFFTSRLKIIIKNEMPDSIIRDIHSDPILQKWESLSIENAILGKEDLDVIMENGSVSREFECVNSELPLDYRHPKAFRFHSADYDDARWMQIEDLMSIKNIMNVTVGENNFNSDQMKTFLYHWINADHDMFCWMSISLNEDVSLDGFFESLVVLEKFYRGQTFHFTLSKSKCPTRKFTLLVFVHQFNSSLRLTAWRPNEPFTPQSSPPLKKQPEEFGNEYQILELLEKRKKLEARFKAGSWLMNGNEIQEIIDEDMELGRKLDEFGVMYNNGIATIG